MLRYFIQLQILLIALAGVKMGHAQNKRLLRPALPAITYEVSKVTGNTGDQNELDDIFNTVRKAQGGTLTKPEFLRRLKAREEFVISHATTCTVCNGWKRVIPKNGKRGADGKVNCKTCKGSGKQMRKYIVKWKSGVLTHRGDKRNPYLSALYRKLGDHAPAEDWFSIARSYEAGKLSKTTPDARKFANAAYQKSVTLANEAWRPDEPKDSNHNRLHRQIIDEGLKGIASTAPRREERAPVTESAGETPPTAEKPTTNP